MHTIGDVLPIPSMWVAPVAFNTSIIKTKGLSHWPLECPGGSIRTFSPRHRIPDSPAPAIALEEVPKSSHRDIHTVLILQTGDVRLSVVLLVCDGGIRTQFFCQRGCSHLFVSRELEFGFPRICYSSARHLRAGKAAV